MSHLSLKHRSLQTADWAGLIGLEKACLLTHSFHTVLYWDALKDTAHLPRHFFYYEDKKLSGFLSYFLFDKDVAHVSILIHSNTPSEIMFGQLLEAARPEILKLEIHKIILGIAESAIPLWLRTLNTVRDYSEYELIRTTLEREEIIPHAIHIHTATETEAPHLARLDELCFNGEYAVMLERFQSILNDKHRIIWLASINQKSIGKIHARIEKEACVIHDLCITPDAQNKGYGTYLLRAMVNHLIAHYALPLKLEVITENEKALVLYEKCHFKVVAKTNYITLEIK